MLCFSSPHCLHFICLKRHTILLSPVSQEQHRALSPARIWLLHLHLPVCTLMLRSVSVLYMYSLYFFLLSNCITILYKFFLYRHSCKIRTLKKITLTITLCLLYCSLPFHICNKWALPIQIDFDLIVIIMWILLFFRIANNFKNLDINLPSNAWVPMTALTHCIKDCLYSTKWKWVERHAKTLQ